MSDIINALYLQMLESGISADRLLKDEPMARHTTFKVGGPADLFLRAACEDEIIRAMEMAKRAEVPCIVMGNGSNMLVRDGGIAGLVIQIGECMSCVSFEGEIATVQAGCLMSRLSSECIKHSLTGMEALGGIPGTLGGASAMNAGAYDSELKDVLISLNAIKDGRMRTYELSELDMSYRHSRVQDEGLIVTSLKLRYKQGDPVQIRARADDFAARRKSKQPLSYPSAGSTFKRPKGYFAGGLIEECGLKGMCVGGAQISELHAGFVINTGDAKARDILELIELIEARVFEQKGVNLEPEVRIIGRE